MRQAKRDFGHAVHARRDGDFEWACFAAQQAAEKALKSAFQARGKEGWGHSVLELCQALADEVPLLQGMVEAAKRLDRHYIPSRYPNGFASGAPLDFYVDRDAETAINDADQILRFCESLGTGAGQS
ncbi:MAG: HEPN domain-containing protein [Acidobacteria bacterium]|nr:HEPN domain-containing protein [Acidobacteriota bacterium]